MYDSIGEVKTALSNWRGERITTVSPAEWHIIFKLPFEVEYLRESLSYRFVELTEAAISLVESSNFLGAVVVARSAQETLSVLYYINELIQKSIGQGEVSSLCDKSYRLMFGKGKKEVPFPDKISVITMIQKVDKIIPGFEKHYDALSEYSHPNWSGTMGIFAKTGEKERKVDFQRYIRGEDTIKVHLTISITTNASLFEYTRDEYEKFAPDLLNLCSELSESGELLPQISHHQDESE